MYWYGGNLRSGCPELCCLFLTENQEADMEMNAENDSEFDHVRTTLTNLVDYTARGQRITGSLIM